MKETKAEIIIVCADCGRAFTWKNRKPVRCAECAREREALLSRQRRQHRKANRLCVYCSKPIEEYITKLACAACAERHVVQSAEHALKGKQREYGHCIVCSAEVKGTRLYCGKCAREANKLASRKVRKLPDTYISREDK